MAKKLPKLEKDIRGIQREIYRIEKTMIAEQMDAIKSIQQKYEFSIEELKTQLSIIRMLHQK